MSEAVDPAASQRLQSRHQHATTSTAGVPEKCDSACCPEPELLAVVVVVQSVVSTRVPVQARTSHAITSRRAALAASALRLHLLVQVPGVWRSVSTNTKARKEGGSHAHLVLCTTGSDRTQPSIPAQGNCVCQDVPSWRASTF